MSKLNPKLKKDDRIVLVHMDGESIGAGIKGKVLGVRKYSKYVIKRFGVINMMFNGLMMKQQSP
jgi:hypothetical protein